MAFANPTVPNLPDFDLFIQNSMQIPSSALLLPLSPPAAPTLTAASSGGSLPTETVYGKLTYLTSFGETTPSSEASVSVTGPTGQVTVPSPAVLSGATGYNVYASNSTGTEVLQNTSPISIGTNYTINSLSTGTASPPTANDSGSPWPGYAFYRALNVVFNLPTVSAYDYVLTVYNCAGHILLSITPDVSGSTYFQDARASFDLLDSSSGVIATSADQNTSNSFQVIENLKNLTVGDLGFFRTPYGRFYLDYAMSFGDICGLS